MPQILSQDEIDALLGGIANQQVPTSDSSTTQRQPGGESSGSTGDLPPYDFTRSEISTRGRLPGLEVILNDFSRRLQSMFASQLGKSVDVNYDGMEIVPYGTLDTKHAVAGEHPRGPARAAAKHGSDGR